MCTLAKMFGIRNLWLIFLLYCGTSWGQVYNFEYLNNQNGLPQSQAYTICFDSHQVAWIGTQGGGIAVYDGAKIAYFTKQDSLISNRIYTIKLIEDKIYIGCKGGLSIASESRTIIKNYHFKNPAIAIQDIIYYENKVWLATTGGLFFIEGDELVKDRQFTSDNIQSFFIEDSSKMWLCTTKGILQYTNPINKINKARGLKTDFVTKAIEYDSGWLIGTYGAGLKFYDKQSKINTPSAFSELRSMIILDLLSTEHDLWIATMNNGVFVYNNKTGKLENFRVDNGLSNDNVKCIVKDKWGNKWLGTSGGGVSIFNNSPFLKYNKSNGLNNNYIYSVLKDSKQNLWVGTQGLGVVRVNDTSTILFDEEYGFASVKTKVIFEDARQNIWLGTEGSGIGLIPAQSLKDTVYLFKTKTALSNTWVKSFSEDKRRSRVYIATTGGIYSTGGYDRKGETIQFRKVKTDTVTGRINDIKWNSSYKRLYFASDKGVGFIKNNRVTYLESGNAFRTIIDFDSMIWCGGVDVGLLGIRFMDNDSTSKSWINQSNGLNSNNIYQLTPDFPFLWVGTEKGLTQLNLNTVNFHHYGYDDGFEGVETNINASYKDRAGNLWFGTTNGLFVYNNANVIDTSQYQAPFFCFDDVQLFYQSILETDYKDAFLNNDTIILPYSSNHIGFKMNAIHYTYQNRVRYRWRLAGAEEEWGPPLENDLATYSNLNPGEYTFMVKASIDDSWNMSPLKFSFKIEAPYWERTWFKSAYISAISLIVLSIFFFFYRRNKKRNAEIIEKIEIEKSILELEQKALRLQMNPHFIFNVLNSIHNLIILNDSGKARYALSKFSKLMRQVLENSREKMISIDDEIDTIRNYIQLERLTTNMQFELEVSTDDKIDTNEAILPPLMIQPFIENSIIHGFKNIRHEGLIKLNFYLEGEEQLVCEIEDNGVGRVEARQNLAQKENYHKSTALQVTQERLANLNSNHSKPAFEIIDLTDTNGNSSGTKVVIRIDI